MLLYSWCLALNSWLCIYWVSGLGSCKPWMKDLQTAAHSLACLARGMLASKKPSFPDITLAAPVLGTWPAVPGSRLCNNVGVFRGSDNGASAPLWPFGPLPLLLRRVWFQTPRRDLLGHQHSSLWTECLWVPWWAYSQSEGGLGVLTFHFLVPTYVCQTEEAPQVSISGSWCMFL